MDGSKPDHEQTTPRKREGEFKTLVLIPFFLRSHFN